MELSRITKLIAEQFPQWGHLPIRPVGNGGIDNHTFRLGGEMLIRLPSNASYAPQVKKEQKWLPKLAPHLTLSIPEPLAMGQPTQSYPWNWSIYRWIEGKSANQFPIDDLDLESTAVDLAQFLNELHKIDTTGAPMPGAHNYKRGAHPSVYDEETRAAIASSGLDEATPIWEQALSSTWDRDPVWIHGDFSNGNILLEDGRVTAIIDFGCMGVGDPACDLVIAWTFLRGKSRALFESHLPFDEGTWARARGWALWKALISPTSPEQQRILSTLLNDH